MLFTDLDLLPFYHQVARHPVMAAITRRLHGLKPTRPTSLFEMAVIAIIEQQISLVAAHKARQRLVERFGEPQGRLWAFPPAERLAQAAPEQLVACGLSRQKAGYVHDLARLVSQGQLDLTQLLSLPDEEARNFLTSLRGFGRWSAEYILLRGLGRPDCLPLDDLAIRRVAGRYLGDGSPLASPEMEKAMAPFAPFRGLAAFYLLAYSRQSE
jgi:DNA-3-methyladenine glycosylase II